MAEVLGPYCLSRSFISYLANVVSRYFLLPHTLLLSGKLKASFGVITMRADHIRNLKFMSRRNSNIGPSGTWFLLAFVSSFRSLSLQLLSVASASASAGAHHSWWRVVGYALMTICISATKGACPGLTYWPCLFVLT